MYTHLNADDGAMKILNSATVAAVTAGIEMKMGVDALPSPSVRNKLAYVVKAFFRIVFNVFSNDRSLDKTSN